MTPEGTLNPMSYQAEEPMRQSQMNAQLERQGMMLADLIDATDTLERRLAPVLIARDPSQIPKQEAEVREVLAPMPDMLRQSTDTITSCVARLRTILNTLEV